jgi:hypothetical protein
MSLDSLQQAELCDLIDAMYEQGLDAPMQERLEALLLTDDDACRYYLGYSFLHGAMSLTADGPTATVGARSPELEGAKSHAAKSAIPPIIIESHASLHSSFASFVTSALFSYLTAAVIVGVGLLVAGVWTLSEPPKVARQPLRRQDSSVVGRITGMADCVWEGSGFRVQGSGESGQPSAVSGQKAGRQPLATGHSVYLGDRLALKSGLLEITYDTGARVLLQGPVAYEVESLAGGYLSVGKLTAKLEKRSEVRGQRSESANQKSEIRNQKSPDLGPLTSDLFAIRTPSAIVTDLGTEFGVEVDRTGMTRSHVFQGAVMVQLAAKGDRPGERIQLRENESLQIEKTTGNVEATVVFGTVDPSIFVRVDPLPERARRKAETPVHRWKAYSEQLQKDPALVAYYTFESLQRNNPAHLPNLSAAGSVLDGQIHGAEWVLGRLPDKYALLFHGPGSGDRVVLPDQEQFNFTGPFTIAVWFKVIELGGGHSAIVTKGDQSWRFQQGSKQYEMNFASNYGQTLENGLHGKTEVADRRWHLGVAVYEPQGNIARKRLYVDGQLDALGESPLPLNPTSNPVWIGSNSAQSRREFHGWIDEVMIFARALSPEDVQRMYGAGNPAAPSNESNKTQ